MVCLLPLSSPSHRPISPCPLAHILDSSLSSLDQTNSQTSTPWREARPPHPSSDGFEFLIPLTLLCAIASPTLDRTSSSAADSGSSPLAVTAPVHRIHSVSGRVGPVRTAWKWNRCGRARGRGGLRVRRRLWQPTSAEVSAPILTRILAQSNGQVPRLR